MRIGGLIFPDMDQADLTGPYEVLSKLPGSTFELIGKARGAVREQAGLLLTATLAMSEAPPLDVLVVPGGPGVDRLLEDAETLAFVKRQAAGARYVLSVCTGALLCGAAGLLAGKRATTHWMAVPLLACFGATAVDERVVTDGKLVSAAGVTSGIDGALHLVSLLAGREAAERIQLGIQYAPEPPFASGSPRTAPAHVVSALLKAREGYMAQRRALVERVTGRQAGTASSPL